MKRLSFAAVSVLSACILTGASYAQEFSIGARYLDPQRYRSIPLAAQPIRGELPAAVDLSADFPKPGYQGTQGSCVAWAVAYGLKSYQEKRERRWDLTNTAHVFSPAAMYNSIKLSDCQGGSYIADAFEILTSWGAISLADFPYDQSACDSLPNERQRSGAGIYRISSARTINAQSISEVKSHLTGGFPVVIAMDVYSNFSQLKSGVYNQEGGSLRGGHAMVLVGYNDSKQAFKVQNSWGTDWGFGGYGWIGYEVFRRLVHEAYVSQDIILGPEDRNDTNRPTTKKAGGDVTLLDGFRWYGRSGFSFGNKAVVAWNSNAGDLLVSAHQNGGPVRFFLPFDVPPYNGNQDQFAQAGIQKIAGASFDSLTNCPLTGYSYHWQDAQPGEVYCVRKRSGEGFVKIKVQSLDGNKLDLSWQEIS